MKYLYRILRLFFCPHKYETIGKTPVTEYKEKVPYKILFRQECRYCGKHKTYTVE